MESDRIELNKSKKDIESFLKPNKGKNVYLLK